ncbi:hypothetical protein [Phenylobacterium sp.]|uniref:hypothetical protein n=1 Tax=Phenylobacterium sp. TaxID=1871053 RepID=UPI002FC5C6BA
MIKTSAWLAIVFGLVLGALEAVRNWGDWQWWPFWVVDYLAATLLVVGGVLALRRSVERWLSAGWGFACAMFWMSFFGHYGDAMKAGGEISAREQRLTLIIGILFGVTVVGLLLSLLGKPKQS